VCARVRARERDSTCLAFSYTEVGLDVGCYVCFDVPKFINIYYEYVLLRVCREFCCYVFEVKQCLQEALREHTLLSMKEG